MRAAKNVDAATKKAVEKIGDAECTYFLCPDGKCMLFEKPDCHIPCDKDCPHKAKKAIVCWHCGSVVILPYGHFSWCRVDCLCGAMNMQRMSSKYRRVNVRKVPRCGVDRPKKSLDLQPKKR